MLLRCRPWTGRSPSREHYVFVIVVVFKRNVSCSLLESTSNWKSRQVRAQRGIHSVRRRRTAPPSTDLDRGNRRPRRTAEWRRHGSTILLSATHCHSAPGRPSLRRSAAVDCCQPTRLVGRHSFPNFRWA